MSNASELQATAIGSLSVYPELFHHCILIGNYFTDGYRELYEAMKKYYDSNGLIELTELVKYKGFDIDLYTKCTETAFTSDVGRFNHIQKLLIKRYKERVIEDLTTKLRNNLIDLSDYDKDYRKIIDLHETETSRITAQDLIQACNDDKKSIDFHRFKKLEHLMRLKENDLVIVAGATGGGKSGFALNLVEDLSVNYKCLYFNLEMVHQELLQRLISIGSGLHQDNIAHYSTLPASEINKANTAINRLSQRDIHVISKSQTLDTVRANIVSNCSDEHLIVIIDHIGLIGTKSRNAYERMTEIAKELRKYSLDYNCTIIGLCQLNREATKTSSSPKLSMLRDSGEIEQSASKVLFVWKDERGYSLVLEKNRSGGLGIIDVNYHKPSQRMEEI